MPDKVDPTPLDLDALEAEHAGCDHPWCIIPPLLAQAREGAMLRAEVLALEGTIMAVVHTVGGLVEGAPTARINFLQRLRALVATEAEVARLRETVTELLAVLDEGRLMRDALHALEAAKAALEAPHA